MSEAIRLFLAGSFQHDTPSVFKISIGGGALQPITVAEGWYRTWLAATGGGGTSHTDPKEYLAYIKGLLNTATADTNWTVRMGSSGLIQIAYSANTFAFTWDGTSGTDKLARNTLGFTANIGTTAAGTFATASAPPCFCVSAIGRENDDYWQSEQAGAWDKAPNGIVWGWQSGLPELDRSFTALMVPTDTGTIFNEGISPPYSPVYPDATRWTAPMSVPTTSLDYVYSWFDFVHTMGGRELGCAIASMDNTILSTFANVQSGSATHFDKCYLHPDTIGRLRPITVAKMYHPRRNIPNIRLTFRAQPSV